MEEDDFMDINLLQPHQGGGVTDVGYPERTQKVSELERNKFTILFPKVQDKARVLSKGPWTINRELFVVKDVLLRMSIREMNFSTVFFWVRFLGLPRDSISEANVQLIAAKIGRLVEIDKRSLGIFFSGNYVRARVEIIVHKPLAASFFQKQKRGSPRWIQFKYERLQDYCFKCATLGHDYRVCNVTEGVPISNGVSRVDLYGSWLRAECEVPSCFHKQQLIDKKKQRMQRCSTARPEPSLPELALVNIQGGITKKFNERIRVDW
ncbi:Zinc knuckle CX2CX4HX4C [Trema orientale]|uniref:Zinc knuckle CX2CX4HX4C n=1 Tax=Trema orientale TaxID=63057 RepID=A0A2P5AUT8_TREOI|nr:Zinc knuckle CX2CX4HX4C [Trema orientale]